MIVYQSLCNVNRASAAVSSICLSIRMLSWSRYYRHLSPVKHSCPFSADRSLTQHGFVWKWAWFVIIVPMAVLWVPSGIRLHFTLEKDTPCYYWENSRTFNGHVQELCNKLPEATPPFSHGLLRFSYCVCNKSPEATPQFRRHILGVIHHVTGGECSK